MEERRWVYADNGATTKISEKALKVMTETLEKEYGNPSSLYSFGQIAKEKVEEARESIAKLLGAEAREIYFTSGGSEADNQAINSLALLGEKKGKKHIISTAFEHHAVLHTLEKLKRRGFEVTLLPVNSNGVVKVEDFINAIRPDTAFATIMYANNEIGTIQPIKELGAVCKEKGIYFHTDAVQAVGHIPVSVVEDNVDMLSVSAHKFHGPKGVGVLYCKKTVPLYSLIEGGAQERNKRAGTENVAGIVATAVALKESVENMPTNTEKLIKMRERLIDGLLQIPHTRLNGDRKMRLPGNVNVSFEGIEGESLLLFLDDEGVMASSGSACTSGSLDPSHVLLAIGIPHEVAHGSLRLTLSEYNEAEDVDYIIAKAKAVVERLRDMSPVWRDLKEGKKQYVIQ